MSNEQTVATCSPTIGDIFRTYGPTYLKKFGDQMPSDQIKALVAIMRCRTLDSGSVVYRCSQCQKLHYVLKSCGNRHCPVCQGGKAKAWLQNQLGQLLPCAYFMLTFTVPAEFRSFMRSHPRECYKALFKAAKETLVALAKEPKYIGSPNIGATAVLHTWGRDLNYHPHLHFIVPGGAIGLDGKSWLSSRVDFLIPVLAASALFRAKYKAIMDRLGLLPKESHLRFGTRLGMSIASLWVMVDWHFGISPLRLPSCDQQQSDREGRTGCRWHWESDIHVPPQWYECLQTDDRKCRRVHSSVLATCTSLRLSKGASLRLRSSTSQDELGMVVDVGDGDIEHGVRLDRSGQADDREANIEMPRVWRCVGLPRIRTERTTPLARVRHELTTK
jgi:hypothetical protein